MLGSRSSPITWLCQTRQKWIHVKSWSKLFYTCVFGDNIPHHSFTFTRPPPSKWKFLTIIVEWFSKLKIGTLCCYATTLKYALQPILWRHINTLWGRPKLDSPPWQLHQYDDLTNHAKNCSKNLWLYCWGVWKVRAFIHNNLVLSNRVIFCIK